MSAQILTLLVDAFWQTLIMVLVSCAIGVLVGIPLGIILLVTQANHLLANPWLNRLLSAIVNGLRSIPFIVLMVAIIPLTRLLVGSSIGTAAAIVPLSLATIPFVARLSETALDQVAFGLTEASQAMGATPWQIIFKVLLPESLPSIVRGITLTLVTLVGYSAMAGAVGGGGLGDVAIRYGYQRFELDVMFLTVAILIALVQLIQVIGDLIAKYLRHD